jgi:hypothetical protein
MCSVGTQPTVSTAESQPKIMHRDVVACMRFTIYTIKNLMIKKTFE